MKAVVFEQSKFVYNLNSNELFRDILLKIKKELNYKIIKEDKTNLIIEYKVPISFKSWGEKVKIQIFDNKDGTSIVEISSRPIFFLTLLDYGKNRQNINQVKNLLSVNY